MRHGSLLCFENIAFLLNFPVLFKKEFCKLFYLIFFFLGGDSINNLF